jgi:hypothetical protein
MPAYPRVVAAHTVYGNTAQDKKIFGLAAASIACQRRRRRDELPSRHWHVNRQYSGNSREVGVVVSKSDIFILVAVAIAFVLGVVLFFSGHRDQGIFVATWVPAVLAFGIYFKLLRGKR